MSSGAAGTDRGITDGPFIRTLLCEWARTIGPDGLPEWARPARIAPPAMVIAGYENAAAAVTTALELCDGGDASAIGEHVEQLETGWYAGAVLAWRPQVAGSSYVDGDEIGQLSAMWLAAARSARKIPDDSARDVAIRRSFGRAAELGATAWALAPTMPERFWAAGEGAAPAHQWSAPAREWWALWELLRAAETTAADALRRARASKGAPRGPALRREARELAASGMEGCAPGLTELIPTNGSDWFVARQTVSCLTSHARWESARGAGERETRSLIERTGRAWAAWSAAEFVVNGVLAVLDRDA